MHETSEDQEIDDTKIREPRVIPESADEKKRLSEAITEASGW